MPPFIIYSLPRSRSFWLSNFLSHGGWHCGHDQLRYVRGLDDIKSLLATPLFGSAETAAAPWWRLIQKMRPDIKTAVIRRPVAEVVESLLATGVIFERGKLMVTMRRMDAKLDQIEARVPGVLSVRFDDLKNREACGALMSHCIGHVPDYGWWESFSPVKMTSDLHAMARYCHANMPQMERVARLAKQRILAGMSRRADIASITFQTESFETAFADAARLLREHCVVVGEPPESFAGKNLPLMAKLDDLGALQILTARSNGRMFGYLVTIIGPSLESTEEIATHTTFFASPSFPGLGRKLLNEATARLQERGIGEIVMRAGVRGDGPRLTSAYQRMGAVDDGRWFKLDLKEA